MGINNTGNSSYFYIHNFLGVCSYQQDPLMETVAILPFWNPPDYSYQWRSYEPCSLKFLSGI